MVIRLIILAAAAIACVYGIAEIKKDPKDRFFQVAACGVGAVVLSRIYYILLLLSNGADTVVTVGTLGQAAAYLFFSTANLYYLQDGKADLKPGLLNVSGTFIACVFFALCAAEWGSLKAYIGVAILILSMGSAMYISMSVLSRKNRTFGFNICVSVLVIMNALSEYTATFANDFLLILESSIAAVALFLMLPLLKKGADIWRA